MTMLGEVIALVSKAFKTETDKGGHPYIMHCLAVMDGTRKSGLSDDVSLAAAVAHDLGEDKPEYLKQLADIASRYKCPDLLKLTILLTRRDGESYREFINRIINSGDIRAIKIKKADLRHNSCLTRLKGVRQADLDRIKKYHKSYLELDEAEKKLNNG